MKAKKLIIILCVLYFLWVLSLLLRGQGGLDDFNVFFNAGKRLHAHDNIYGPPHFCELHYFYSPLFASVLSLFSDFSVETVKLCWFLLNVFLLWRCYRLIYLYTNWEFRGSGLLLAVLFVLTGKTILINFMTNQATTLMLWTILESFHLHRKNKILLSLLVLCLGINIKILPLLLIPYFMLTTGRRGTYALLFSGITIVLLLLPALWLGWSYNALLLGEWWAVVNPLSSVHVVQVYESGFMDIGALVSKYFSAEPVVGEPVINLYDMSAHTVFIITNMIRLALLGFTLLIVRHVRSDIYGISSHFIRVVPFAALIPLLLPHQRDYSFLLVIPLLVVLTVFVVRKGQASLLALLSIAMMTSGLLAWSDITGHRAVDMFYDYRLITVGMSAFVVLYLCVLYKFLNLQPFWRQPAWLAFVRSISFWLESWRVLKPKDLRT